MKTDKIEVMKDKYNRIVGYLVPVDEKMTERLKKRLKKYSNKFIALKNSKENKKMKIRKYFVSNSSSSSFIVAGDNVMEILKRNIDNNQIVKNDYCEYTVGQITSEMISQCTKSTVEMIKGIIAGLVYQSASAYEVKCFLNITGKKSNCYDFDDVSEDKFYDKYHANTLFDINDKMKEFIRNGVRSVYKESKSRDEWDYYKTIDNEDFEKISNEIVDDIYRKIAAENKEMYAVSFGDNHGDCSGDMGWLVEDYYLGENAISDFLNSKINVYHLNCH